MAFIGLSPRFNFYELEINDEMPSRDEIIFVIG